MLEKKTRASFPEAVAPDKLVVVMKVAAVWPCSMVENRNPASFLSEFQQTAADLKPHGLSDEMVVRDQAWVAWSQAPEQCLEFRSETSSSIASHYTFLRVRLHIEEQLSDPSRAKPPAAKHAT